MAPRVVLFCRVHGTAIHQSPSGWRGCLECRKIYMRRWRAQRRPQGIIPGGISLRSYWTRMGWITRRLNQGPTKMTLVKPQRRHVCTAVKCRRGHLWSATAYVRPNGSRICKICDRDQRRIRRGARPQWVGGVSIATHDRFYRQEMRRLRAKMIVAHPDKGQHRATGAFILAHRALKTFIKREMMWYTHVGINPPFLKRA